ncbi:MAG: tetratricopeptide repeat protein [Desulfosudaceae bacterium]
MKAFTFAEIRPIFDSYSSNRPFANLTLALNYYAGEDSPYGYHLVNLLLHLATALLVFILAQQTIRLLPPGRSEAAIFPLLAALAWLVIPVHVQSVTYTVQRMNALAAFFYLLALVCYVQARRTKMHHAAGPTKTASLLIVCLLAAILGLASKETAATLPVMILAYEWYFFQDLDKSWLKKQSWRLAVVFLIILGVGLVYMDVNPAEKLTSLYATQTFTMGQRLLTEPRVIIYYLSLLLFPHPDRLMLVYDFPLSTGLISPTTTLLAITTLVAMLVFMVTSIRRQKLLSFALLWFLATLFIESSFLGLAIIFEHRTYLPSVFPIIALTWVLRQYIKPPPIAILTISAMIITSALWTYQRNVTWSDELSLWRDNTAKAPQNGQAHNNLGMACREREQPNKALEAFQQAIRNDPYLETAYNNLGMMLRDQGEPAAALPNFQQAISLEADYYDAWYNLGLALYDLKRLPKATEAFRQAITLNPLSAEAHNNLGIALMRQGYADKAINYFRRTLEIDPAYKKAYANMGIALLRLGKPDQGVAAEKKALDLDPYYLEAYNNMRRIRWFQDQYGQKIKQLEKRRHQQPDNPAILLQLGKTYEEAGMTAAALSEYQAALDRHPHCLNCLNRLANLYARHQRYADAAAVLKKMAGIVPKTPVVFYNLACMQARAGNREKAVNSLKKAIRLGYDKTDRIKTDPDLENIRDTGYYHHLIKKFDSTAQNQ